ncbi:MAG TPA: hypothetical protein DCM21_06640 [Butyrivibrio sp.]|nr:hypothetical protein [Butyrivibrio sp.]
MPLPVQTSEGGKNKKCFSNQEKRVCILIPLVQMSEEINFNQGFRVSLTRCCFYRFFRRRSKNGLLAKIFHYNLINKF